MNASLHVPPHLRQYVVAQDYDAYTERDHAVWRFVLLQTFARLQRTGHPAYASGFAAAGITVERIPRISEMSERLSAHGFGAVCVDGFIPPRAFQAFQANGFLPIAADIRTAEHLAYTPAPDIIHEAAGHAPFLSHPAYARYLRRIGAVSERAFSDAYDRELYEAVYLLSELKEDPASTPEQVARAEAVLADITARAGTPSEAARMARLYWWTVEYGLVGTPEDYRLYGAGLLSSLGEGHFCHSPGVKKLPLTAACIDVSYDITRPQPQLYVARDFEQLEQVLEDVEKTLSHARGGITALLAARESGEPATLELDSGSQLSGIVHTCDVDPRRGLECVTLDGPAVIAHEGVASVDWPRADRYVLPLGAASDGTPLSGFTVEQLRRRSESGMLVLELRSGIAVRGRALDFLVRSGRTHAVLLADCEITWRGQTLLSSREPYPLLLAREVVTAAAGAPRGYHRDTQYPMRSVPKPRQWTAAQRELISLHEEVLEVLRCEVGSAAVARFERMYQTLTERHPDEWLLRWNVLAGLVQLGEGASLAKRLEDELTAMETRFAHREPIATGLEYLREHSRASPK